MEGSRIVELARAICVRELDAVLVAERYLSLVPETADV
jgi:hypothetical protein